MDSKPPIDLERLKQIQDAKKKDEVKPEEQPRAKPHPSLTDPYYNRRHHLISIFDFDEWP